MVVERINALSTQYFLKTMAITEGAFTPSCDCYCRMSINRLTRPCRNQFACVVHATEGRCFHLNVVPVWWHSCLVWLVSFWLKPSYLRDPPSPPLVSLLSLRFSCLRRNALSTQYFLKTMAITEGAFTPSCDCYCRMSINRLTRPCRNQFACVVHAVHFDSPSLCGIGMGMYTVPFRPLLAL